MKEVIRQEQKYVCTLAQSVRIKSLLSSVLKEDTHNEEDGYIVRSLYFDTLYDNDFHEKGDGVEIRKKMRLRIYHPEDQFAFLEMKQKQGKYQKKRSLKMHRNDAMRLCEQDYSVLLQYEDDFARECYIVLNEQLYFPKVIVQYNRFAYDLGCNATRITFDSHLSSTSSSFDLFDPHLNLNEFFEASGTILEVKFNNFLLSYVKDLITLEGNSLLSVSKYYLSRQSVIL